MLECDASPARMGGPDTVPHFNQQAAKAIEALHASNTQHCSLQLQHNCNNSQRSVLSHGMSFAPSMAAGISKLECTCLGCNDCRQYKFHSQTCNKDIAQHSIGLPSIF